MATVEQTLSVWQQVAEEFKCDHPYTQLTRHTKSNGVHCVYVQCVRCGDKVKEASKAGVDILSLPVWNTKLRDEWNRLRTARLAELEKAQRETANQQWWKAYNAYLRTSQWAQLRRRVIVRDGFRCQNCFTEVTDSTAVCHHKSYDGYNRRGHSFAFECVTLCKSCHDDYHADQS